MKAVKFSSAGLLTLVALSTAAPVFAATAPAAGDGTYTTTANATFAAPTTTDPGTTPPVVDPGNPGGTVSPGTDPTPAPIVPGDPGNTTALPFTIDYAPTLTFPSVPTSTVGDDYANLQTWSDGSTSPNYVQVTDNRGTAAGWNLYAQVSDFTLSTDSTVKLVGATLNFANATNQASPSVNAGLAATSTVTLNPAGGYSSPVATAAAGTGTGTTVVSFGGPGVAADTTGAQSVYLNLQSGSVPVAGTYNANLTWDLTAAP